MPVDDPRTISYNAMKSARMDAERNLKLYEESLLKRDFKNVLATYATGTYFIRLDLDRCRGIRDRAIEKECKAGILESMDFFIERTADLLSNMC